MFFFIKQNGVMEIFRKHKERAFSKIEQNLQKPNQNWIDFIILNLD